MSARTVVAQALAACARLFCPLPTPPDPLLQQLLLQPFVGVACLDLERGSWLSMNDRFCTLVGYSSLELAHLGWSALVNADDGREDGLGFAKLLRGDIDSYSVERTITRGDGTHTVLSVQISAASHAHNPRTRCVVLLQDLTQSHQSARRVQRQLQLHAALSECNRALVRSGSQEQLLARICMTLVSLGGMKLAWIGMLDRPRTQLLPVASFGAGAGGLESIAIGPDASSAPAMGTAETAVREDRPVWLQDLAQTPSSAAIPLHRAGLVIGALVLMASVAEAFDPAARRLIAEMATDIDFALDLLARTPPVSLVHR